VTQELKPDHGLPRRRRVTLSRDFARAYNDGTRYGSRLMTLWVIESSELRLGVVAGKKVGNAVKRAKAKRRMREAWRTSQNLFSERWDMILSARFTIENATSEEIKGELLKLAKKAGVLR
jgi:ribonuclease P protein component